MKINKKLKLTKTLFILFGIGTVIALIIVYMDLDSDIAYKFVLTYVVFAFFMLLYVPIITIINSRKLKWKEIKKRLFIFIILLILSMLINYGLDYIRNPLGASLFEKLPQSLGLSFIISFYDIIFLKNKGKR